MATITFCVVNNNSIVYRIPVTDQVDAPEFLQLLRSAAAAENTCHFAEDNKVLISIKFTEGEMKLVESKNIENFLNNLATAGACERAMEALTKLNTGKSPCTVASEMKIDPKTVYAYAADVKEKIKDVKPRAFIFNYKDVIEFLNTDWNLVLWLVFCLQ